MAARAVSPGTHSEPTEGNNLCSDVIHSRSELLTGLLTVLQFQCRLCFRVCLQQTTEALTVPSVFSNLQEHLQGWRQPPNQQHSIIKTIYNTQGCTQLINSKVKPRIKTKIWLFLTWLFLILVCLNLYKPNPDSVTPLQEHTKFVLKINK